MFLAIHATTMESYLFIVIVLSIKHLKPNLGCFLVFAENAHLSLVQCILLRPIINSSMEKETGKLGWKALERY